MARSWAVLGLLALGACATIVEGDDQTVSVITAPPEASCELTRGGTAVAFVNPTPGSVVLEKSNDNISVLCKKMGHFDGAGTLASSFQGMTFGNIIFGGLIGVAVDAASGAMHEYPASIMVVLVPKTFSDAEMRDRFFDRQKERLKSEAATAVVEVRKNCRPAEQDCDGLVEAIEAERDARLEELDARSDSAAIE